METHRRRPRSPLRAHSCPAMTHSPHLMNSSTRFRGSQRSTNCTACRCAPARINSSTHGSYPIGDFFDRANASSASQSRSAIRARSFRYQKLRRERSDSEALVQAVSGEWLDRDSPLVWDLKVAPHFLRLLLEPGQQALPDSLVDAGADKGTSRRSMLLLELLLQDEQPDLIVDHLYHAARKQGQLSGPSPLRAKFSRTSAPWLRTRAPCRLQSSSAPAGPCRP